MIGLLLLARNAALAAPPPARTLQVTAVFLFNFAQFIRWPTEAFADPDSPIVIGVLGDDSVRPYLDAAVRGERVDGRRLVSRYFARASELQACHILFIPQSAATQVPALLPRLAGHPVVTVGEAPGFITAGGMIRLVFGEPRTRIRVNLQVADAAHVTISSKLLRFAEIAGARED
jgi:hypothetical protein